MIREFENIAENYGIPAEILEKIEYEISGLGSRPACLTALQKEVIGHPDFWCREEGNRNLILQGATSSGKTLAAELLALQCVYALNRHVVYLVPLKALVSEKVQQFKRDIQDAEKRMKLHIFASSSDYQDHDTELAEGQYDIAVVVYEKFFAMMAEQKDNKFLEKCGLIVVDEMQLLGSQDRGAKLEYALTKVRNNYPDSVRILGLTTVDCDTGYVSRWLDAGIIKNASRPVSLNERILSLSGLYWERRINESGEQDTAGAGTHTEGRIVIEDEEKLKNQKIDVKRTALLCSLLKRINADDGGKKIIVFASSRERCKGVARNIARSGVFGRQPVPERLKRELEKADDESERTLLQNELLPFGVAYHSAALPMSLRELIELEFRKNDGSIRLIVATETLTIGMNLPADVMILYDNKVFRGSEGAVDIRPQEYKNYIGRAGRLGITERTGESYLFVNADSDISYYWKQYVDCRIEEISSALIKASARESAPYYLNLLCKGKEETFSEETIEELAGKTLNASEWSCRGGRYEVEISRIIKDFKKVELIKDVRLDEDELDEEDESAYKLTNFGEMLAPYALSIETCFRIRKYFRDDGNKDGKSGGLPLAYSGRDLKEDRYLLDILYTVCKMSEVRKISHPGLPEPKNPRSRAVYQIMETAILGYLDAYRKEKGPDAFWENSEIERVFFGEEEIETDQLNAALRAILLTHWIKGELPSEIREHAGLKNKEFVLYMGDMARIGESSSYIVEAVSKCLFTNARRMDNGELEHVFYRLSVKLKYGLSDPDQLQTASRHVYGLSRSTIIRMDRAARSSGFDNLYLFIRNSGKKVLEYLTAVQRRDLLQQMSERYDERNVEHLIAELVKDDRIDFSLESDFQTIARPRHADEWLGSLKNIFVSFGEVQCFPVLKDQSPWKGMRLQWEGRKMYMLLLAGGPALSDESSAACRSRLGLTEDDKLLFLYHRETESASDNENDIRISAEYLSRIILKFMDLNGCSKGAGIRICDYLYEQKGAVADKGMRALKGEIEEALRAAAFGSGDGADEQMSSYEKYIRTYEYEDLGLMETSNSHAVMHRARGPHGIGRYVIKEICIPESVEEFELLEEKAGKLYERCGPDTDEAGIRTLIREWCGMELPEEDEEAIMAAAQKREAQLHSQVRDRRRYYFQTVVFLAEGYRRFNEARLAAQVPGSYIVGIANPSVFHADYEHESLNGVDTRFNGLRSDLFFTMDAYEGSIDDLRPKLRGNREEIIRIGRYLCEALIICHRKEILHRDIKPANILYRDQGGRLEYGLCDFGSAVRGPGGKTRGVGTERFMAPEAYQGDYSVRSDLYSLGRTLHYLYKGIFPGSRDGLEEDELVKVLSKACEREPSARYADAEQFKEALEEL